MKRVVKALAVTLAGLLLLPVLGFFAYDALVFLPHRDEIQSILVQADPQDRAPPPQIRRYISAMHQRGASPSSIVGRSLHSRFLTRNGMLRWHMRTLLWTRLLSLHFSKDEIIGLYSTLAYNGRGHGLNALSNRLFSKPLSALSSQEAATVVAYTWGPSVYEHHPEWLIRRRDILISRVQGGP